MEPNLRNPDRPTGGQNGSGNGFDIEHDIARLKRSGYVWAILLIVLVVSFLILLILSLSGYFQMQQIPEIPKVVKFVYPVVDKVPVYNEPSPVATLLGHASRDERYLETKRVPGFIRIENDTMAGWVDRKKVMTKLERVSAADGLNIIPLDMAVEVLPFQNDIMINGKIINQWDKPIRNIKVSFTFLDMSLKQLATENVEVYKQQDLPGGGTVDLHAIGHGLLKSAPYVAYEIDDFDIPPGAIPTPEPVDEKIKGMGGETE